MASPDVLLRRLAQSIVAGVRDKAYAVRNGRISALDKADVGLSDVDNTSDAAKPVSTATQTALDNKVDKATGQSLMTDAERAKLSGIATGATANATDAQLRARSTHTGTQAISTVSGLQTALDGKINTTERGVSGGIPTLDEFARIPASQLPSYVDDVLEYLTIADFPATGEGGKIYIAINQGTAANPTRQYRWTGSVYAEINPSPGTTDALAEGSTNLYFNESRVRNTVLTGLSLASSAAVAATDTVLAAFGKIQAQLGLKAPLDSPQLAGNPTAPTAAASDNDTSIATTAFVRSAMALFGLGGASPTVGNDANVLTTGGIYSLPSGAPADFLNFPAGAEPSRGRLIVATADGSYGFQLFADRVNNDVWFRSNSGGWKPWVKVWHTDNLVKQTSSTDTTAGAVLTVGAANLLTAAASEGFEVLKGSRFLRAGTDGPLGSTICGGLSIGVTGAIEQQLAMRLGRAFFRSKGDADSAWKEFWHTGNFDPATKQDKASIIGTATTRTLALTDAWNYVRPGTTSAITLTVPTNASVAFDIGTEITVRALGNVTLAAASGVTLNAPSGGTLSMTARMTVTLKKVATDVWDVIGQTVAA